MRLIVDTSVLVGELLRARGRERLGDRRLDLFLPQQTWAETTRELPGRITAFARNRHLDATVADELTTKCLRAVTGNIAIVAAAVYSAWEKEARARSRRDPDDWPVVACALALSAGIWTNDNDFLGTGVATWTTETLQLWLERAGPA